jgi:hypothetical protein
MSKLRFSLNILAVAAFVLTVTSMASAQATRTWVSGVGDDVNPCSRTAPCKTWAGAISKTAANGEIDALDPGGFGALTITKNITIEGTQGAGFGSTLASLVNGFVINDSATASPNTIIVSLRNLSIQGAGNGTNGVRFTSGKKLSIENCVIAGFRGGTGHGIDIALTTLASGNQDVRVTNTVIKDNLGAGIRVQNTAGGGAVLVTVDNCNLDGNANGMLTGAGAIVQVSNTHFTFNTTAGLQVGAGTTSVDVDTCFFNSNTDGIRAVASTTRIANCRISGNGNGINFTGGAVQSFGDNKVKGNFTNDQLGGAVTNVPAPSKI